MGTINCLKSKTILLLPTPILIFNSESVVQMFKKEVILDRQPQLSGYVGPVRTVNLTKHVVTGNNRCQ
jgi:hypothetical protein